MTDHVVAQVSLSKSLQKLYLSRQEKITDTGVVNVIQNCPELEVLNVSRCLLLTDKVLDALCETPMLNTLYLAKCSQFSAEAAAKLFSHVKKLNVLGTYTYEISQNFPEVNDCVQMTNIESISSLAESNSKIEWLDLTGCTQIDTDCIKLISTKFPWMSSLSLAETLVSDPHVSILSKGCASLESINFSNCPNITGQALPLLLNRFPKLTRLYLSNCLSVVSFPPKVVIEKNVKLDALFLPGTVSITDEAVGVIFSYCENLSNVVLTSCTQLTDLGISRISNCQNLEMLDLTDLGKITDASLIDLGKFCTNLTNLVLSRCVQVFFCVCF